MACASLVDGGAALGPTKQPTRKGEREIKHLHYKPAEISKSCTGINFDLQLAHTALQTAILACTNGLAQMGHNARNYSPKPLRMP